MSRIARVAIPDVPYHLTQRGNGRRTIFYNDTDRRIYLDLLTRYAEEHRVAVWAYCLMSNHVHIVAVPQRPDSLARALGRTHACYARYRNLVDRGCGHVWEARYFSCPLDRAHLWRAVAYVERNPVRAGVVEAASDYPWSSARAHLGEHPPPPLLHLGVWQTLYDPRQWRLVLREGVDEADFQERIREASKRGRPLGSDGFVEKLEQEAGRRLRPNPPGRPRKNPGEQKLEMSVLSRVFTVSSRR
jgi:putative transposase